MVLPDGLVTSMSNQIAAAILSNCCYKVVVAGDEREEKAEGYRPNGSVSCLISKNQIPTNPEAGLNQLMTVFANQKSRCPSHISKTINTFIQYF
jgi:hypothetical protein